MANNSGGKKWRKKEELLSVDLLTDWIKNEILKQQTKNYFIWSISKAWKYLIIYNVSNVLSIILPATIPVIVELRDFIPGWQYIITIISFLSSILVASAVALRVKELWRLFRNVTEQFKTECMECLMSTGKYKEFENITDEKLVTKERLFCENIEKIHNDALLVWKDTYYDSK